MKFDCMLQYSEFVVHQRSFPDVPPQFLEDIYQVNKKFNLHSCQHVAPWFLKMQNCQVVSILTSFCYERAFEEPTRNPLESPFTCSCDRETIEARSVTLNIIIGVDRVSVHTGPCVWVCI